MKRHRRIRTGYRIGTKKKPIKKTVIRVLFVVLCAAMLTLFSVLLGTYLKEKADLAGSAIDGTEAATQEASDTTELYPDGIKSTSNAKEIKVCAADIDITAGTPSSAKDKVYDLSDTYNAVSVKISSADGKLLYVSEALLDYVRLNSTDLPSTPQENVESEDAEAAPDEDGSDTETKPEKAAEDTLSNLKAVIDAANEKKFRKSAVFKTNAGVLGSTAESLSQAQIDSVIVGEIASFGFDEIIIGGLVDEDTGITHDSLKTIITYLTQLRARSGQLDIGVVLPASLYLIPQSASIIKTLSEYVDFLAIEISVDSDEPSVAYSLVFDNCHSLKGNFSVYNIRGMITAEKTDVACAVMAALRDLSAASLQFSVYVADPYFDPHSGSVESETETETNPSNDNAMREEDYLAQETAIESESASEPDTTVESTTDPETSVPAESSDPETETESESESQSESESNTEYED